MQPSHTNAGSRGAFLYPLGRGSGQWRLAGGHGHPLLLVPRAHQLELLAHPFLSRGAVPGAVPVPEPRLCSCSGGGGYVYGGRAVYTRRKVSALVILVPLVLFLRRGSSDFPLLASLFLLILKSLWLCI